jgi:hypothetical protein
VPRSPLRPVTDVSAPIRPVYSLQMHPNEPELTQIIDELARKYGVSREAVKTLSQAIIAGNGTMAQFSHPELGGQGQWLRGGMTMIGDMFNDALKAKVVALCSELSARLDRESSEKTTGARSPQTETSHDDVSLFIPAGSSRSSDWWGADLGTAGATGSQNDIRYAYFPASRRLAVKIGDRVRIYDTGDHKISGVSQQQSGDASLTFVSQRGLVRVSELRTVG